MLAAEVDYARTLGHSSAYSGAVDWVLGMPLTNIRTQ